MHIAPSAGWTGRGLIKGLLRHAAEAGAVILALAFLSVLSISPVQAEFEKTKPFPALDEFRFGVFDHNVETSDGEGGLDINVELLFGRPQIHTGHRIIDHFLTPRPHIGGSVNTEGDTSQFYFGFTWDYRLMDRLFFESSFGGAVHDGPLDEPGTRSYGCTWNFRESASLGIAVTERMRIIGTVEHMSNANLCDRNGGLTNAGVRLGYKLN